MLDALGQRGFLPSRFAEEEEEEEDSDDDDDNDDNSFKIKTKIVS